MINPIRSFNVKVLGWFWLTLLVCLLSIAVPAFVLQQLDDDDHLNTKERKYIESVADRIDKQMARHQDISRINWRRLNMQERSFAYQMMIVDNNLKLVMSTEPVREHLLEQFSSKRFWYFMQSEHPRTINIEWTRLMGPVTLSSNPDWKLVLWRPERPRPLDVFRTFPVWGILAVFLVVTSIMSWLLVRSIARPLTRLGKAFTAVGNGQLSHKIDIESSDSTDRQYAANTQFARLFGQFNDMTARIAALIQNQKRQSADISHELRTPLTRLQMTLALLRKKSNDEGIAPLLERAEKESELLNLHIQRLSDLTTMEARAIQQGPQRFTLETLLTDLCEDAAFEAKGAGVEWRHALLDVQVVVYEEPMLTAIENVVRNAFKYASSSVSLTCELTAGQSNEREGQSVVIRIADDGPGVEPEELACLTKAFYRTDSARHSETGGLGLGLAIAAEAVRLNGGSIAFSLNEPTGLIVSLTFPLA